MIKKSLISFAILFGLHALFVLLNPSVGAATNQWQDNLIKAQSFLYEDCTDTIMVGTSLSARIIHDSIPSVTSISLGGCSVEDGLRIVNCKKQLPHFILVEDNFLLHNGNEALVATLTEGTLSVIRGWVPSLREQYQPICLLASLILRSSNLNSHASHAVVDMDMLNAGIAQFLKEDVKIDEEDLEHRMADIQKLIGDLEQRGVKFVFFEMPVNERLYQMYKFSQIRDVRERAYPASKYCYLPSDTTQYLTTDGLHLSFVEQQVFSHYFKKTLAEQNF